MTLRIPIAAILLLSVPSARAAGADAASLFQNTVRPVLDDHCVKCHGPLEQKGGLELDNLDVLLAGGDSGPVVTPGDPAGSPIYAYLDPDSDPHMPPKKQLPPEAADAIRQWIVALAAPEPEPAAAAELPVPDDPVAAIDFLLAAHWSAKGVTPAPECDDRTFARRAWLDLAGRIPSPDELSEFLYSGDPDKYTALVDRLLAAPDFARHLREVWDVLLMGRATGRREDRRRDNGWFAFLEDAFAANRPWNEVVRDIIAARPPPARKGAVWFLYERRDDHQRIAEAIAPVIYGSRIDCAQCHDHLQAREIKQGHYWGLVAAFARSRNADSPEGPAVAESAVGGFMNFTNVEKESSRAVLTILGGPTIEETWPAEGEKEEDSPDKYIDAEAAVKVPRDSRRERLAQAATENNPLLAAAFANRMWAALTGRGLVHPADEINSRHPADLPKLFDRLSADFRESGYDVRRLVRSIALSRAYRMRRGDAPDNAFAGAIERPLTAEQIARSWQVVAGRTGEDDPLRRATAAAIPDVMPVTVHMTFQQAGFLANDPEIAKLLAADAPGLQAVLTAGDDAARVRAAFLRVFGRLPDAAESEAATALLATFGDNAEEAVRQLLWGLMTSAEFLLYP